MKEDIFGMTSGTSDSLCMTPADAGSLLQVEKVFK